MVQIQKSDFVWEDTPSCLHFAEVELRIGNTDESQNGLQQWTGNPLMGYYPSPNLDLLAPFEIQPAATGRFMTLQILMNDYLVIAEITVFNEITPTETV